MLITTGFDLPGYDIISVQGEIFGLTVRARNIGAGCIAGLALVRRATGTHAAGKHQGVRRQPG